MALHMHGAAKIEANWRLLFDIALACGESVQKVQLTYPGFLNFLHAAELLSVKTGVYLVLIERLWGHHAISWAPSASQSNMFDDSVSCLDKPPVSKRRASYEVKKHEVLKLGICGFEGFCDMMNVIAVRCFQCRKCVDLYTKDQESLAQAILLSAEDVVALPESVKYTAQRYLKSFINRNVVKRNTKLFLNPMMNDWTKFTNVVITHIIGSLLDSVVLPLFRRYSKRGLMYERHFYRLVDELFSSFSIPQKAAAHAIFTYSEFFDVRELLQMSRITTTINDIADVHTLSCESFVEALMMLGLIAFGDEQHFPHHRSLTAKTWFVFENIFCRAAGGVAMAEDIVFARQPQSIRPVITFAFPHYVPIEQVSSCLISGLNINPLDPIHLEDITSSHPLAVIISERLLQPVKVNEVESQPEEVNGQPEDSLLFSSNISPMLAPSPLGVDDKGNPIAPEPAAPVEAERKTVTEEVSGTAEDSGKMEETSVNVVGCTAVASTAEGLGNASFEAKEYSEFDSPVYGMRVSRVFINEVCVDTIYHGHNYVEVLIPPSFTKVQNFRMSVRLEENVLVTGKGIDGETYITRYVFLPVQRVTVSLRNEDGKVIYSSTDVLLHTSAVFQVIPSWQRTTLRAAFDAEAEPSGMSGEERLPRAKFAHCCRKLGLVSPSVALVACQAATQNYFNVCRECDKATLGLERDSLPLDDIHLPDSLNFHEFMCIIAQLCIRQAGTTTDVPNVVNFVSASLGKVESESAAPTPELHPAGSPFPAHSSQQIGDLPPIPYTPLIEVPYENALKKRCRKIAESADAAESFQASIRIAGGEKVQLSGIVRELPPFPSEVAAESAVSQYEMDEVEGLGKDIHEVSLQVQEEFMLDEIIIKTDQR